MIGRRVRRRDAGMISTEFVAGAALLLLPTALLVALLPRWSEIRIAAIDAADQAARTAAVASAQGVPWRDDAVAAAQRVLAVHDVDERDGIAVTAGATQARAEVTVQLPLLPLGWEWGPGMRWTATRVHPVDPYRARLRR